MIHLIGCLILLLWFGISLILWIDIFRHREPLSAIDRIWAATEAAISGLLMLLALAIFVAVLWVLLSMAIFGRLP